MKQISKCLFMLALCLTVVQGAWAQISYIERSWDATNKQVVSTENSITGSEVALEASPTEEQYKVVTGDAETWLLLGGYNTSIAEYYVVSGDVTIKNINVVGKDVHLILCDGATLTLTAGLKLEDDHKLSIHCQSYGDNMGRLMVTNSYDNAAGIGSAQNNGDEKVVGELVIHGGHIETTGGKYGAGIGTCARTQYGSIDQLYNAVTVYGGYVEATGGYSGAGIGGGAGFNGRGADGGTFTLYDGTVIAQGGDYASGVGGGGCYSTGNPVNDNLANGGKGGIVNIYGGTLTATGGSEGAGIGSGNRDFSNQYDEPNSLCGGTVNIYGGTVTAQGGDLGAGIGGGDNCGGAVVTIEDGTMTATGGTDGAGIGGGEDGFGGTLTINGGTVYAYGTDKGAGIGGGKNGKGGNVAINGGTVIAKAGNQVGEGNRAIGPGTGSNDYGNLTIGDMMTVWAGTETSYPHFPKDQRSGACQYSPYAKIEPCTHSDATLTIEYDIHKGSCAYCLLDENDGEIHSLTNGKCNRCQAVFLNDDSNNGDLISGNLAEAPAVFLCGRTLYRDGTWNTLCLPFNVQSFSGTILENATVKELSSASFDNETGILTLNFSENQSKINGGTPYIVKWDRPTDYEGNEASYDIVNPRFDDVVISVKVAEEKQTEVVTFKGLFSPYKIAAEDKTMLYLGADSKLYYPNAAMTINAFRAYFTLNGGLIAGTPASPNGINNFVLNFGGEETGISLTPHLSLLNTDTWFTLDGRKLNSKPTAKGIYINNGNKVVIK